MRTVRTLWACFEPIHSVTYFAPESIGAFEELGLRGFWRGYFAGRAAALGVTGPEPVVAAFYGFAPTMVGRAIPDVWERITPEKAFEVRAAGAAAALRRVAPGADFKAAADVLERAAADADLGGRVLAAAHAALPRPTDDVERLWHAASILREHRGDGHVAVLVANGLDPCESVVLRSAIDIPRETIQPFRGWTDEEWDAARERLRERGLLDGAGKPAAAAIALREQTENATDTLAERPWRSFGGHLTPDRVVEVLMPVTRGALKIVPRSIPIALPRME